MSDNAYRDFETRKSVHINLTRETHTEFRIKCLRMKLSMQEVFEELARQIVENDPSMVKLLGDLAHKKRNRQVRKLSATDAESIYRVIESSHQPEDNDGS